MGCSQSAIPALNNAIKDENKKVRSAAITSLRNIKTSQPITFSNANTSQVANTIVISRSYQDNHNKRIYMKAPAMCKYKLLQSVFWWKCRKN
jgi:hypothetical protein